MSQDNYDIPEVFRRAMEEAGWQLDEGGDDGGDDPRRPLPPPQRSPRFNRILILITLLLLGLFSIGSIASFYTEWLWFDQLGYLDIFTKQFITRLALFAVGFIIAALLLVGNWMLARRRAIADTSPLNPQILRLPIVQWGIAGAGLVLSVLFAGAVAGQWGVLLRYFFRVPFNISDPIFNHDIGFYIFELPLYEFVQGWFLSVLFVVLLGLLPIYAINHLPEIQRGVWRPFSSSRARSHVLGVAAVFVLVWAAGYLLDIYGLLYSSRGVAFGASYTDMTASLWALRIQFGLAVITAGILVYNIFRPSLRSVVVAGGAWLLAALILGSALPTLLQRYVVEPNELNLETPYIQHNMDATRAAFNLDTIDSVPFGDVQDISPKDILENEETLRNVRLWDYRPLQQTFEQLQALRPYYEFGEVDVDRYEIDGQPRQVMLAARELDKSGLPAPSWVNRKLEFTHGYGLVMNPVNEFTREGQPEFFIKDLPPQSNIPLEITQPEIYYGELTNDAVYVSSGREEFSYPSGNENVYTSYAGTGGIVLDSFIKRLAFSIRESDANVLLSNDIDDGTRIQFNRNIHNRLRTLTPFLMFDEDPYLVVTDEGRLVWIQDAYTASNDYPYSTPIGLQVRPSVASTTPAASNSLSPTRAVNYMRNSVKITVDAYDGNVIYYVADTDDPLIQTYSNIFPGVFRDLNEMPEDLVSHLRYPVDLFWAQARQYLTYHMTDIRVFYNKEDLWQVPNEIFDSAEQTIEPYYVTLALPGEEDLEYLLILPFTPSTKNNMISWMAARNDGDNYGELVVYDLPKQELIFGPMQVEGRIDQDPAISQQFSLWDQRGSRVIRGNLLVLPINQSFLYVEPVYLLSDTNALPELKRVIVATNKGIAMEDRLEGAILALAESALIQLDEDVEEAIEKARSENGTEPVAQPTSVPLPDDATFDELVLSANAHLTAAEEAQQAGDWARYGQELEALRVDLERLLQIAQSQP